MLDNHHLSPEQATMLKEMYHSRDDIHPSERHLPYQTKVEIFEKKCIGCGYAILRVVDDENNVIEFATYQELIEYLNLYSFAKTLVVERGCSYNTEEIQGLETRPPYWDVNEIVSNTCVMWNSKNIPTTKYDEDNNDSELMDWYTRGALVRDSIFGVPIPGELFLEEHIGALPALSQSEVMECIVKK